MELVSYDANRALFVCRGGERMDKSGSNSNHTTRVFSYILNHKLSFAGIAASAPVLIVASSAHIFSQSNDINNSDKTSKEVNNKSSSEVNSQVNSSQEESSKQNDSLTNSDSNTTSGNNSQASVSIDGQSVSSSTSSYKPDQSLNKTITTENGVSNVSIELHNQSSEDGTTHSTNSVHVDSHSFGSDDSSASINQRSYGGQ
jgi:hypothetical protein